MWGGWRLLAFGYLRRGTQIVKNLAANFANEHESGKKDDSRFSR